MDALIPIIFGAYFLLLAVGILPKKSKDPEKLAAWRAKYGGAIKILAPLVILWGFLRLFGILH